MANEVYNIVGEVASLSFGIMIVILMLFTRPRITFVYKLCSIGLTLSVIANAINIVIIKAAGSFQEDNFLLLGALMIAFIVIYFFIIALLFSYISFLSAYRRKSAFLINIMIFIVAIAYTWFAVSKFTTGEILVAKDGVVELYIFEKFLIYTAFIESFMSVVITIIDYDNLSKIVKKTVFFFFAFNLIILQLQYLFYPHIFISITYVLPFALFYIVFHANPHDELMGSQDKSSFETMMRQDKVAGKNILYMFIKVPRLTNFDFLWDNNFVYLHTARCTRRLENLGYGITIFNLGYGEFAIRFSNRYFIDTNKITGKVVEILKEFIEFEESNTIYRLVVMDAKKVNFDPYRARMLFLYILENKIEDDFSSMSYIIRASDYDAFEKEERILSVLRDISYERNLNDERVLCYAQPIFDVTTGEFRTAEALMRLEFGEHVIGPRHFIGLAEKHGYIHTLTCVMLNKVCKEIKKLEDAGYDFDGVTLNCSSIEFSSKNMYKQLFKIIFDNKIQISHIRMELTESALFSNSSNVITNMKKLNEAGVIFYLDDFGTGYSNFERVREYPFNIIKFDKSLLYAAEKNDNMSNVMSTMVNMFKAEGCQTLVEGVENDYQNKVSLNNGFDFIQGYRYAVPEPIEALENYFKKY